MNTFEAESRPSLGLDPRSPIFRAPKPQTSNQELSVIGGCMV